jgi:hypothetical protein
VYTIVYYSPHPIMKNPFDFKEKITPPEPKESRRIKKMVELPSTDDSPEELRNEYQALLKQKETLDADIKALEAIQRDVARSRFEDRKRTPVQAQREHIGVVDALESLQGTVDPEKQARHELLLNLEMMLEDAKHNSPKVLKIVDVEYANFVAQKVKINEQLSKVTKRLHELQPAIAAEEENEPILLTRRKTKKQPPEQMAA